MKLPKLTELNERAIRRLIAANLPPPLDLPVLAELNGSKPKEFFTADLLSGLGLLASVTTAACLPMCPAYDCSAAAALSCFHVFALQSRGAFDARWCKGSISEKIFEPWQEQLVKRDVSIRGGARVSSIEKNESGKYTVSLDAAIVLAVGATAAGRLAASSPPCRLCQQQETLTNSEAGSISSNLRGGSHSKSQLPSDVANAMIDSPIAVCGAGIGNIEELDEAGFCIYDLQRMHEEWSVDYYANNNVPAEDQLAVIEVDFFRADAFVDLDNDGILT
ncbi:hypothetical protein QTG54_004675 [Skeletonema marinoi]|uniref:Uncharacterized protein n=1 Tax=Skeletonema marinoi TaxID=267567 RepID=A0AAD8YEV2_9STRA|nr:hypothetical protein QTG54_004675 [Skeletonema marinoi]